MIFVDLPYGQTILIAISFILLGLIIFFLFYSFLSRWLALAVTLFILSSILQYLSVKPLSAVGYILSLIFFILAFVLRHKHTAKHDPWDNKSG